MIRFLVLLAALSGPAMAQPARVISGEHSDFTRLVVELPAASGWTVGRTAMGYGFTTAATTQPGYDLSRVWDRIPRSRLQALRVDAESGALLLALACDCHVFPFEYQPGMVVLDIRNGPAPPGSEFESRLAPTSLPPPEQPPLLLAAPVFDWLGQPRIPLGLGTDDSLPLPLRLESATLGPLRDELLMQLSRGAVDGVVDIVLPGKTAGADLESMGDLSGALIRIGELPGLEVGGAWSVEEGVADGCIPDTTIDLASWGEGRPPLDLLVEARADLYTEFDSPSPDALLRAVQAHLYLGFGAEARQYGALLSATDADPQLAPLLSMTRLIDGDSDPTSPFATMLGCDGSAALWAALAHSDLPTGAEVDADAIVRSFQALPPHLRRHLGPRLATLLLPRDPDAARIVRDAVERTPDVPAGTVALIDAAAELQAMRPEAALGHAEAAVVANGSGLAGLVALVEAHFQSGVPLSPDVAESLTALRDVAEEDRPRHDRAMILALALSGQVEQAYALAGSDHPDLADLWQALARHADDSAFLAHAVLRPTDDQPSVDTKVGLEIAVRLADLGFPEAAAVWLGPIDSTAASERRMVAAAAELALGNARGALQLLSGLTGPEVSAQQAAAYQQLGAYDAARQVLDSAGQAEASARLAAWDADWAGLAANGSAKWAEAATRVTPPQSVAAGPLAEGQAALDDSAAARTAISALLAEVPQPSP